MSEVGLSLFLVVWLKMVAVLIFVVTKSQIFNWVKPSYFGLSVQLKHFLPVLRSEDSIFMPELQMFEDGCTNWCLNQQCRWI